MMVVVEVLSGGRHARYGSSLGDDMGTSGLSGPLLARYVSLSGAVGVPVVELDGGGEVHY